MHPSRLIQLCSGALGAIGVLFGALGAHYLSYFLDNDGLSGWETAVDYQLVHALLLFSISRELRSSDTSRFLLLGAYIILAGTLMFSGSIYLMTLGDLRWLWPITPIGGVMLILGWCSIIYAALRDHFRN